MLKLQLKMGDLVNSLNCHVFLFLLLGKGEGGCNEINANRIIYCVHIHADDKLN